LHGSARRRHDALRRFRARLLGACRQDEACRDRENGKARHQLTSTFDECRRLHQSGGICIPEPEIRGKYGKGLAKIQHRSVSHGPLASVAIRSEALVFWKR
jgi:hypothetical protein